MKIFGINFGKGRDQGLTSVGQTANGPGRGWLRIFDWRPGAWQGSQADPEAGTVEAATNVAVVYACLRLIMWDISKLPVRVMRLVDGIWKEGGHQTVLRLLRRPNPYQGWIDFIQSWLASWLIAGNAYIVKGRLNGLIVELHVLDPTRVLPVVASDTGEVFYQVNVAAEDALTGIQGETAYFRAVDMIHHRYMALGHPLVGTSALARAQAAARTRAGILTSSADLYENGAVPPGLLIAPEDFDQKQLDELSEKWTARKKGRIAVVSAAFKFESLAAKYIDSQAKEFGEVAAVDVCVALGVPPWKVNIGTRPAGFDVEAQQIIYFQDCLQLPIEHIEALLDTGLDLAADVSVELDVHALVRMDSKAQAEYLNVLVKGSIMRIDEARAELGLEKVPGGSDIYMQQQNFSLKQLQDRPSAPALAAPGGAPGASPPSSPDDEEPPAKPEARRARPVAWAGVFAADITYDGDCFVTHQGSLWAHVAPGPTLGLVPGTPAGAASWALAVKRGQAPQE